MNDKRHVLDSVCTKLCAQNRRKKINRFDLDKSSGTMTNYKICHPHERTRAPQVERRLLDNRHSSIGRAHAAVAIGNRNLSINFHIHFLADDRRPTNQVTACSICLIVSTTNESVNCCRLDSEKDNARGTPRHMKLKKKNKKIIIFDSPKSNLLRTLSAAAH